MSTMTPHQLDEVWKKYEPRCAFGDFSKAEKDYAEEIRQRGGEGIQLRQLQQGTVLGRLRDVVTKPGGAVGLSNIKLSDGTLLVKGRKVTGFSNQEEKLAELDKHVPYLTEDELKARGAVYERTGEPWQPFAVEDQRVITGQNPAVVGPSYGVVHGDRQARRSWKQDPSLSHVEPSELGHVVRRSAAGKP